MYNIGFYFCSVCLCFSGRSQATEEEMQKLKQNYCDLLGHQNKKQKIKHIIKLKDENTALRKVGIGLSL